MGSKKKKQVSDSSSSSSESGSDSSDSSPEKHSKRKSKKQADSSSEAENSKASPKKTKSKSKTKKRESSPLESDAGEGRKRKIEKKVVADDHEAAKHGKRRRSQSPESKDRKSREEKRVRDDQSKHDDRRNRQNDYNRSHDDRFRNRRPDYRNNQNRRDDRGRDYRNRRDDGRNYSNRDRDRDRDRNNSYQRRRSNSFDHGNAKWGKEDGENKKADKKDTKEKEKPNFALSGKLTEETNTYRGVVIKYSEPPEARKPKRRWRLYPFKGEKALQTLYIHRESAYLIGRDRKVVDLPVDHPSCSKQHAALQYRLVPFTRDDGTAGKRVRPYLIDLNSANGTYINNKKIESSKYVELLEKDVIKFGYSSREYVLLHENSKDEAQDDDVKPEDEVVVAVKSEDN